MQLGPAADWCGSDGHLVNFDLAPHVAALASLVPQLGHVALLGALLYLLRVCEGPALGAIRAAHLPTATV